MQRQLQLSPAQVHRLDAIFERERPARIALHEKIGRLEADLARCIRDEDEVRFMRVIAELGELQRVQNTRRTWMLLEMYRLLTPVQRRRLEPLARSPARR